MNTPSLDAFAQNMTALVDPVRQAADKLKAMDPVEPGAFYQADQIRSSVTGASGDGGLRNQYQKVLTDLTGGLTDLSDSIKKLSAKYQSSEDLNKVTADQVTQALDSSTPYFSGVVNDVGASGTSTPSS